MMLLVQCTIVTFKPCNRKTWSICRRLHPSPYCVYVHACVCVAIANVTRLSSGCTRARMDAKRARTHTRTHMHTHTHAHAHTHAIAQVYTWGGHFTRILNEAFPCPSHVSPPHPSSSPSHSHTHTQPHTHVNYGIGGRW
jgi:hypothetical protein